MKSIRTLTTLFLVVTLALIFEQCLTAAKEAHRDDGLCVCPRIYLPVCASNGHTYPNYCEFSCQKSKLQARGLAGISVLFEGTCEERQPYKINEGADLDPLFSAGNLNIGLGNRLEQEEDF